MRRQEATHYRVGNYLSRPILPSNHGKDVSDFKKSVAVLLRRGQKQKQQSKSQQSSQACSPTDSNCRAKMVLWCYQVVDYCNLHRETVEVALRTLDRFLCLAHGASDENDATRQEPHPVAQKCLEDRQTFQLAAMTCLYTAIKMSEVEVMDPSIVASLSRGMCTEAEVIEMESTLLMALDWRISAPTAHAAADHLVQLLDASSSSGDVVAQHIKRTVLERARHYIQLAVVEYRLASVRPTLIAYAAIVNALESISPYDLPSEDRMAFVSSISMAVLYPPDDIDNEEESLEHSVHESNVMIDTIADLRMSLSNLADGQRQPRQGLVKTASGRCVDSACSSELKTRVSAHGASPRCVVGAAETPTDTAT